jgi:hypothetical protein
MLILIPFTVQEKSSTKIIDVTTAMNELFFKQIPLSIIILKTLFFASADIGVYGSVMFQHVSLYC